MKQAGSGYVGNFTTLTDLNLRYPASQHAGRTATISSDTQSNYYISDGQFWGLIPSGSTSAKRYAYDWGVRGDTGNDQTANFLRAKADLAAEQFCGEFVLPSGLIEHQPIDWSGMGKPGRFYYQSSDNWVQPPAFVAENLGATQLKLIGSPANVTAHTFSVTEAQAALGITRIRATRFQGIEFIGPGTAVQKTTLAADATAGTSFSCVGAVASVGDAVALINGKRRHWATVLNVSGTGPQTITIDTRQAILATFATSGTTVLFFKQTRLLQIGGTRTAASVINSDNIFEQCAFTSAFQGVCLDDALKNVFDRCLWKNVVQNVCYGFQIDSTLFNIPYSGSDFPFITATCTPSSNVITVSDPLIAPVGSKIWEEPNVDGTLNFPEHTYIIGINGTSVTLSENYAGSTPGSKTLTSAVGVLISAGNGGSAYLPACPANNLGNTNSTTIIEPVASSIEKLIDNADALWAGLFVTGGYAERNQRIMVNGTAGGSGSGGPFVFQNYFVQDPNAMVGPAFEDLLGGQSSWDIRVNGITSAKFPLFAHASTNFKIRLRTGWGWVNNSTAALYFGQTSPPTVVLGGADNVGINIRTGAEWSYNDGAGGFYPCQGAAIVNTSFSGAFNWNWPGISRAELTLTGNLTAGSIVYGVPPKGYPFELIITEGGAGGYSVTLGSSWLKNDGTSLGTIAGGTTGKVLILQFISNGTAMILQGHQTPVFA